MIVLPASLLRRHWLARCSSSWGDAPLGDAFLVWAAVTFGRLCLFLLARLDLLFKDRQQFENACEVLPASGSRYREVAFVSAIGRLDDVKDDSHAISPSARARRVDSCLQGMPIEPRLRIRLPDRRQGFHWVFP
jgi:hypothetical protein